MVVIVVVAVVVVVVVAGNSSGSSIEPPCTAPDTGTASPAWLQDLRARRAHGSFRTDKFWAKAFRIQDYRAPGPIMISDQCRAFLQV